MRMRRKKNGAARLAACEEFIFPPGIKDPAEAFGNTDPVHLEIGCGKGDFGRAYARGGKSENERLKKR